MLTKTRKRTQRITHAFGKEFIEFASANDIKINPENFLIWDKKHNGKKFDKACHALYSNDQLEAFGVYLVAQRYLYAVTAFRFAPSKEDPSRFDVGRGQRTHAIRAGIYIGDATKAQQDLMIEQEKQKIKNAIQLLKLMQVPIKELRALVEEALAA